jgi:hypothetical protein
MKLYDKNGKEYYAPIAYSEESLVSEYFDHITDLLDNNDLNSDVFYKKDKLLETLQANIEVLADCEVRFIDKLFEYNDEVYRDDQLELLILATPSTYPVLVVSIASNKQLLREFDYGNMELIKIVNEYSEDYIEKLVKLLDEYDVKNLTDNTLTYDNIEEDVFNVNRFLKDGTIDFSYEYFFSDETLLSNLKLLLE